MAAIVLPLPKTSSPVGLSAATARRLAIQTALGAATMAKHGFIGPAAGWWTLADG